MLIDARELDPGAELTADTCVIGSGPAGLALATRLAAAGRACVILESGDGSRSDDHQSLGRLDANYTFGDVTDDQLDERRQIGGKSNAWSIRTDRTARGCRLIPYNEASFIGRDLTAGAAWPVSHGTLKPYFDLASAFFGVSPDYAAPNAPSLPFTGGGVVAKRFRFADGDAFARRITDEIAPSTTIRLIHHANALSIALSDTGASATHVRCESEPGRAFTVRAQRIVVACGTFGTTALLLRSNDVIPGGVGSQHGLLGRYFSDNPLINGGDLVVTDPALFAAARPFDIRSTPEGEEMLHLQLDMNVLQSGAVASLGALLFPRPHPRNLSPAYQAGRRRAQLAWRRIKDGTASPLSRAAQLPLLALHARHILEHRRAEADKSDARIDGGGWSKREDVETRYRAYEVLHYCEQAPHFDNAISLGEERDGFGQRRITIDWRWREEDVAASIRAQDAYVSAFRDCGWGEYRVLHDRGEPEIAQYSLGHHIGTTRMSQDPKLGVTDADGKIHGVANVYVASASLFPSGGWENPMLTVVALAIRLADRIASISPVAAQPVRQHESQT